MGNGVPDAALRAGQKGFVDRPETDRNRQKETDDKTLAAVSTQVAIAGLLDIASSSWMRRRPRT